MATMRLHRAHPSHQDRLILTLSSMFTVPNLFGAWQRKVKDSEREQDFWPFVPWCLQESCGCVLGLDSDLKSTRDCKLSTWLEFSLHSNSCSALAVLGMAITAWFLLVVTLFFLSQRILHRFMSFNFMGFKSAFIMNCDCTENLLLGK